MKPILHFLILLIAILAVPHVVAGITVAGLKTAILVALALCFINLVIKPIITLITLPITIVTLGLFGLIINGAFFYFMGEIVSGFAVSGFKAAFLGALFVSVVNWILEKLLD